MICTLSLSLSIALFYPFADLFTIRRVYPYPPEPILQESILFFGIEFLALGIFRSSTRVEIEPADLLSTRIKKVLRCVPFFGGRWK